MFILQVAKELRESHVKSKRNLRMKVMKNINLSVKGVSVKYYFATKTVLKIFSSFAKFMNYQ